MALISAADQERLRESFAEMTRPVRLLFFTQTLDCETCLQTRQILDELPPLSDKITIEEVNFVLDGDRAREYGIDRVPAVAVAYEDAEGRGRPGAGSQGLAGSDFSGRRQATSSSRSCRPSCSSAAASRSCRPTTARAWPPSRSRSRFRSSRRRVDRTVRGP